MKYEDNDAYVRAVHDKGLQFDLATMASLAMIGGSRHSWPLTPP